MRWNSVPLPSVRMVFGLAQQINVRDMTQRRSIDPMKIIYIFTVSNNLALACLYVCAARVSIRWKQIWMNWDPSTLTFYDYKISVQMCVRACRRYYKKSWYVINRLEMMKKIIRTAKPLVKAFLSAKINVDLSVWRAIAF